jgi:hypothetical protein
VSNKPEPFAPFKTQPNLNPKRFDPNQAVFVPNGAITNQKIASVSPRKIQLIGAKVYRSTDQTIPDTTYTNLDFNTAEFDEGELWKAGSSSRLTVPYSGIWFVSSHISFNNAVGNTRRGKLKVSGNDVADVGISTADSGSTDIFVATPLRLVAGDYITIQAYHNKGSDLTVAGGVDRNFLSAVYLGNI